MSGIATAALTETADSERVTASFVTTALDAAEAAEVPVEFVAVTVNVYVVPGVRPEIAIGDVVPETVATLVPLLMTLTV
jgi:hypothetical protein